MMPTLGLHDEHSLNGEWHIPRQEGASKSLAGSLTWKDSRARLELHGSWTPLMSGPIFGPTVPLPTLHGATLKSQLVTLLDSWRSSGAFNLGPAGLRASDVVTSNLVIVGAHVDGETLFSEMRLRVPGLHLWLGPVGMSQTFLHDGEPKVAAVVIRYEGVAEELVDIPSAACLVGWGFDRHSSGDMASRITITTTACVSIRPTEPKPLEWFFSQYHCVATFLSLLSGSPMGPSDITVKESKEGQPLDVLVSLLHGQVSKVEQPHQFFLSRGTMGLPLSDLLNKWYAIYPQVEMPAKMSVSILNSGDQWAHAEFLTLMQALEGLHRAIWPEFAQTRRKLALRLDDLLGLLDAPLRQAILHCDTVPDSWVSTRNYYTHWLEHLRPRILTGEDMAYASARLRSFLRALFLVHLGVPQAALLQGLRGGHHEGRYVAQLNRENR